MRICILDDEYDCPAWEAEVDDWRVDPTPFMKDHDWTVVGLTKETAVAKLTELSREGYDLFFNLCAGAWDEESPGIEVVQALERMNVPFTGAVSEYYEPSRKAMKQVCSAWGIGYPDYVLAQTEADIDAASETLRFPLIVKHPSSYSSIDLWKTSRVETTFGLRFRSRPLIRKYGAALIEEFIEGREFTVLVAENPDDLANPVTYVPVEFTFPEGESFKHSNLKWQDYHSMEEFPITDPDLGTRLRKAAADFFLGMRGAGFGRCDLRMSPEGEIFMLEINPKFTDLLIRAGVARHARKQRGWEVLPKSGGGFAVFANRTLLPGETIWKTEGSPHHLVTRRWVEEQWGDRDRQWFLEYAWPLTDQTWVIWSDEPEEWRPMNHSCDPNAWLDGLNLAARREIAPGEEIRVDYATYGNNILSPFDCSCGSPECRGRVRKDDHLQPFVNRYGEHISDFVRAKRK